MRSELTTVKTPEEQELGKKLQELAALESELAERELELATLHAELEALELRYLRIVGGRFAELDQIEARIAEALAERRPLDQATQTKAEEARARAQETWQSTGGVREPSERERFKPSDDLKDLYRQVAKKIHPDLAANEEERARRTKLMAEANRAYEEGDEECLRAILRDWQTSPEAVDGEDTGPRLVRTIRKIARVRERLQAIAAELAALMGSELHELKVKIQEAREEGRDLLAEMAAQLDRQIEEARKRLAEVSASAVAK